MKKRVLSIIVLMLTVLMIGCSNNDTSNQNNDSKVSTEVTDISKMNFNEKYKFFSEHYPKSKILVWVDDNYHEYESELNDYLYKNGYDYIVCFRNLTDLIDDSDNNDKITGTEILTKLIKNNEQIDVLSFLNTNYGVELSKSYYDYIKQGFYEPLDKYLQDKKYSEYVNSMPKKYWDSYRCNGIIYGVDNSFYSLYEDNGYQINNDVLKECNLKTDDLKKPIDKIEPLLKEVNEKANVRLNFSSMFFTDDFYIANYIDNGIAISNKKAVNVFEQPETIKYYKRINDLQQKGLAAIDSFDSTGRNIELTDHSASYGKNENNSFWNTTSIYYKPNNYIRNTAPAVGVYSKSQNKKEAVDLLMNVIYNKDINNVLTYGVEGKNYNIVDGNVEMKTKEYNSNNEKITYHADTYYNNPMISLPCAEYQIVNRNYYKAYETAKYLDGNGFCFDSSHVEKQCLDVMKVIEEFKAESDDIESYLKQFNKKLYDAGMQDILDEANRQLEEFYEKNN